MKNIKLFAAVVLFLFTSVAVFSQGRVVRVSKYRSKKMKTEVLKEYNERKKYEIVFTKDIINKLNAANNDTTGIKYINITADHNMEEYRNRYHCGNWVNFELFNDYKSDPDGIPSFLNFEYTYIDDLPKENECKAIIRHFNFKQYRKRIDFVYKNKIYCYYDGNNDSLFYHKNMNLAIDTARINIVCSKPYFYRSFIESTDTIAGSKPNFDTKLFADCRSYFRQLRDYSFIDSVFRIERQFGDLLIEYQKKAYPLVRKGFVKAFNESQKGNLYPVEVLVRNKEIDFISDNFYDRSAASYLFDKLEKYMFDYRFSEARFYNSLKSNPYIFKINKLADESLEDIDI